MKQEMEELKLIDGTYSATELREVLGQLFSFKISFHNLVVHTMGHCSEEKRAHSARRIAELKHERAILEAFIDRMNSTDEVAQVNGTIQLKLQRPQDMKVVSNPSHSSMQ